MSLPGGRCKGDCEKSFCERSGLEESKSVSKCLTSREYAEYSLDSSQFSVVKREGKEGWREGLGRATSGGQQCKRRMHNYNDSMDF